MGRDTSAKNIGEVEVPKIGRTPKGSSSPRGHSRHFLETPFSEPLLSILFYCKTQNSPLLKTLLRTLPQNLSQPFLETKKGQVQVEKPPG